MNVARVGNTYTTYGGYKVYIDSAVAIYPFVFRGVWVGNPPMSGWSTTHDFFTPDGKQSTAGTNAELDIDFGTKEDNQ